MVVEKSVLICVICGEFKITQSNPHRLLLPFHRFRSWRVSSPPSCRQSRAEVDAGFLDEGCVVFLIGHGTLRTDADLQRAEVAQTDDFATLQGIGNHILQCQEYRLHIRLVSPQFPETGSGGHREVSGRAVTNSFYDQKLYNFSKLLKKNRAKKLFVRYHLCTPYRHFS